MKRRAWAALFGFVSLSVLAFISATGQDAFAYIKFNSSKIQTQVSSLFSLQQAPRLGLNVSANPAAVSPGGSFSLMLELVSSSDEVMNPSILVEAPSAVSAEISRLPAGASFDFQNGRLLWQPTLQGQGARSTATINFTANVANIQEPQQNIVVTMVESGQESIYTAPIWIGVLPMADFELDPPQAAVGQPVRLRAAISGPGPISQEWHLSDGRVVDAIEPIVVFPVSGDYQITLKAANPLGTTVVEHAISILPNPIAHFETVDSTIGIGQEVIFENASGGESPLYYSWDFGDGLGSQEASPVHHYNRSGSYVVHLVVENGYGRSEVFGQIDVADPPIADAVIPSVGTAGSIFEATAFTDDSVTDITWDMGDGRSQHGREIKHVYWSGGDYLVTMTASNEFGSTAVSQLIHVEPGSFYIYFPFWIVTDSSDRPTRQPAGALIEQETEELVSTEQELSPLEFADSAGPADRLLAYINEARLINNMRPLRYVHELSVAAQRHSDDMAANHFGGHTGSDNSVPALRIQEAGYPGGYGGEATAWGMEDPIEPVRFWLSSAGHRAILLHPAVTDVGVGFSLNFDSPNIWYWTAEFGSLSLPVTYVPPTEEPVIVADLPPVEAVPDAIQLLGPPQQSQFRLSTGNMLLFSWLWNQPLGSDQQFAVVLEQSGQEIRFGQVREPHSANQFQLTLPADDSRLNPGEFLWRVELQSSAGSIEAVSVTRSIRFEAADEIGLPSPTPIATLTAPTPQPTATPEVLLQPTPLPIATPLPTATIEP